MNPIDQFRDALRAREIIPPQEIIGDGTFHRADVDAPGGKSDAAYVLHLDGIPAGSICNYRDGRGWETWRADIGRSLTDAEKTELRERAEQQAKAREQAEAKRREDYKARSLAIWQESMEASSDHPYAIAKNIALRKIRLYRGGLELAGMKCDGSLVIPLVDEKREIAALQFINPEGEKRYFGPTAGRYFPIGKPTDADATILVCEGVATGLSLYAATGHAVVVALDAGNLLAVAKLMRDRFPGYRIILCADDDYRTTGNPGVTKATEVADTIGGLLAMPDFGEGRPEKATDFNDLATLKGAEAVRTCVERAAAPEVPTPQPEPENRALALVVPLHPAPDWPKPLAPEAFQGLAGLIVRAIEDDSESDPAAILIQSLVAFGAMVGKGPHFTAEGAEHHARLFALLVGKSAKGRKGSSWSRVVQVFGDVTGWPRVVDGLASGEGLKYAVRDAVKKPEKDKSTGHVIEVEVDMGVADKRLMITESEFAQVLRQCARPGNTLSATIRSAWDSGNLQTLTKNDPVTATGAHVAIVGHITGDELRAELTATDMANGFANRFLFMAVDRSKFLPLGGEEMDRELRSGLSDRIARAAGIARTRGQMKFSDEALEAWKAVYNALEQDHPGLVGAITARGAAQVRRVALVYALMDESPVIGIEHLQAALALWDRCEESARCIFGRFDGGSCGGCDPSSLVFSRGGWIDPDANQQGSGPQHSRRAHRSCLVASGISGAGSSAKGRRTGQTKRGLEGSGMTYERTKKELNEISPLSFVSFVYFVERGAI